MLILTLIITNYVNIDRGRQGKTCILSIMKVRTIFGEFSVAVVDITETTDVAAIGQTGERAARQRIEMMIALRLPVGSGELRLLAADPQA